MPRRGAVSLLLFVAVVAVYLSNGRRIGSGDTVPASYLPWSMLREGNFDLDEFSAVYSQQARAGSPLLDGIPYYLRDDGGHYVSAYTPAPALLALPVYAAALLAGIEPTSVATASLEKLSATLITAASVLLLFLTVRQVATERWALATALVYAFATSSWSICSQALWQHGASQLCVTAFLYFLVLGLQDERRLSYAGFALGAAVAMRSTNLVLLLPATLWILTARRRVAVRFILLASPPLVGMALYNLLHFGTPLGASANTTAPARAFFVQTPLVEGLAGVLASPSHGLFVFSPVLLFCVLGMVSVWRSGPAVMKALALGPLLVVLVVAKWFVWWGGHTWGPRLLADTTPILCFFLQPIGHYLDRRVAPRIAFFALAALSVCAHGLGAYFYDGRWDVIADVEHHPSRLQSWADGPLAYYGRQAAWALRGRLTKTPSGPTSENSPTLLSATLEPLPVRAEVFTAETVDVSVLATNTGRAVWLAAAAGERGVVQLGWRWDANGLEAAVAGWQALPANVLPGEAVRFDARVDAPAAAGEYELLIDLVSHWVTWFSKQGSMPLRIPIRVRSRDAATLLQLPALTHANPPVVKIATDRPLYRVGESLRLGVDLWNSYRPGRFDAYLVLRAADGSAMFYDGRGEVGTASEVAGPWVASLPLPARVTAHFLVSMSKLPPGDYEWHVLLIDTNPRGIAAQATASFSLAP